MTATPIPVFEHRLVVSAAHIDGQGHANNVAYVQWLQDAAVAHSAANGWTAQRYAQIGRSWVVRSHYVEYLRPVFQGERLIVRTWVVDMRKVTSTRRYGILREEDQRPVAKAETRWAFVRTDTGQPCRIADQVRSAYVAVGEEVPTKSRNQ